MGQLQVTRKASRVPQIGDLRDRISIYERSIKPPTFSASAAFTQSHTLICTVWAAAQSSRSNRAVASGIDEFDGVAMNNKITHRFVIRYREDIESDNIIKFKDKSYKIMLVDDGDFRNRFLNLFAELLGDSDDEANR